MTGETVVIGMTCSECGADKQLARADSVECPDCGNVVETGEDIRPDENRAIWITVEHPADPDEIAAIRAELQETALADRYQIIVSTEDIDTIGMDELREVIDA